MIGEHSLFLLCTYYSIGWAKKSFVPFKATDCTPAPSDNYTWSKIPPNLIQTGLLTGRGCKRGCNVMLEV